jgi:hypothetical protein
MICIVEANAPQAKNTPFFRSSSMAVVAKVEPTLKYDILDITAHSIAFPECNLLLLPRENAGRKTSQAKIQSGENPATSTPGRAFE